MEVTLEARSEGIVGEEKKAKWLAGPFYRQNDTFSSEEIWKRIFSLTTEVGG